MQNESQSIDQISKVPQLLRLEKPVRITEQVWPEGTVPVVSIRCITYQHVNFIRDAIEGFLMQETTFPVEILIHDDASTDGTADIVREYQAKYPQLIRTVLQTENQWSKGREAWRQARRPFEEMVRGEFIALCEGDDYWTSPRKLQMQVEALAADPTASAAFHEVSMVAEGGSEVLDVKPGRGDPARFSLPDIAARNPLFTCCLLYRRSAVPAGSLAWAEHLPMGDWPLQIALCETGDLIRVEGNMGVYRRHAGGAWSSISAHRETLAMYEFHAAVLKKYGRYDLTKAKVQMKTEALRLFFHSLEAHEDKKALHYLWRYMTLPPRRFRVPRGQRRSVVKLLFSLLLPDSRCGNAPTPNGPDGKQIHESA